MLKSSFLLTTKFLWNNIPIFSTICEVAELQKTLANNNSYQVTKTEAFPNKRVNSKKG